VIGRPVPQSDWTLKVEYGIERPLFVWGFEGKYWALHTVIRVFIDHQIIRLPKGFFPEPAKYANGLSSKYREPV
jgi:hypothetical protein